MRLSSSKCWRVGVLVLVALLATGVGAADKKKDDAGQREAPVIGAVAGKSINDAIELLNA